MESRRKKSEKKERTSLQFVPQSCTVKNAMGKVSFMLRRQASVAILHINEGDKENEIEVFQKVLANNELFPVRVDIIIHYNENSANNSVSVFQNNFFVFQRELHAQEVIKLSSYDALVIKQKPISINEVLKYMVRLMNSHQKKRQEFEALLINEEIRSQLDS